MDSIWQRHRTFILKILAGLGVCLLAYIIGSSLSDSDIDSMKLQIEGEARKVKNSPVHSPETARELSAASETLRNRLQFLAARVGETRAGEDLRVGLLSDLLIVVGKNTPGTLSEYLKESRQSPKGCLRRILDDAEKTLLADAGLKNVLVERGLGFERVDMEAGQLDRYLLTLKLILSAVRIGIDEGAFEIRQIGILTPPGRFEGEETFLRQYPVTVTYRGPSATLFRILEKLNAPEHFRTVQALRRLQKDRQEREEDVMVMELELVALRVLPEAEFVEVRR